MSERLHAFRAGDLDTKGGRTWAYIDDPGRADIDRVTKRVLLDFYDEHALDPTHGAPVAPAPRERGDRHGAGPPVRRAGTRLALPVEQMARTAADGLRVCQVGEIPWRHLLVAVLTGANTDHPPGSER